MPLCEATRNTAQLERSSASVARLLRTCRTVPLSRHAGSRDDQQPATPRQQTSDVSNVSLRDSQVAGNGRHRREAWRVGCRRAEIRWRNRRTPWTGAHRDRARRDGCAPSPLHHIARGRRHSPPCQLVDATRCETKRIRSHHVLLAAVVARTWHSTPADTNTLSLNQKQRRRHRTKERHKPKVRDCRRTARPAQLLQAVSQCTRIFEKIQWSGRQPPAAGVGNGVRNVPSVFLLLLWRRTVMAYCAHRTVGDVVVARGWLEGGVAISFRAVAALARCGVRRPLVDTLGSE